jgi:hypothetical protein
VWYKCAASRLPARGDILAPVRSLIRVAVHAEHFAHLRITLLPPQSGKKRRTNPDYLRIAANRWAVP